MIDKLTDDERQRLMEEAKNDIEIIARQKYEFPLGKDIHVYNVKSKNYTGDAYYTTFGLFLFHEVRNKGKKEEVKDYKIMCTPNDLFKIIADDYIYRKTCHFASKEIADETVVLHHFRNWLNFLSKTN